MREELQQQDVERWLGFITFLCEVFGTMRSSTGEPFRVLVCPIYTCLREVRHPLLPRAARASGRWQRRALELIAADGDSCQGCAA